MSERVYTGLKRYKYLQLYAVFALFLSFPVLVMAADVTVSQEKTRSDKSEFNIQAQSLSSALIEFSKQADIQVIVQTEILQGLNTAGISGLHTPNSAILKLLGDNGLTYESVSDNTIVVSKASEAAVSESVEEAEEVEEIIVTGSRLVKDPSQLAAQTISFSLNELRSTGQPTLERALRQLPQNMFGATEVLAGSGNEGGFGGGFNLGAGSTMNLRGLGSESTLILVNGKRRGKSGVIGGVMDISGIPLSSIERVDILLDGASAIYGSDAVGGVVNIILKEEFDDLTASLSYGTPSQGGFEEFQFNINGGMAWDTGNLRATYERYQTSSLTAESRGAVSLTPPSLEGGRTILTGSGGAPLYYILNGSPVSVADIDPADIANATPVTSVTMPETFGGSLSEIEDLEQVLNEQTDLGRTLVPKTTRDTLQLGIAQDLTDSIVLTADLSYSTRNVGSSRATDGPDILDGATFGASNPYNVFGVNAAVDGGHIPGVEQGYDTTTDEYRINLGLEGSIGESWDWELSAGHSINKLDSDFTNTLDMAELRSRLNGTLSIDPATAYDLLGGNSTPETIAAILSDKAIESENETTYAEAILRGSVLTLPAGDVRAVVGYSYNQDKLDSFSKTFLGANGPTGTQSVDNQLKRSNDAVFTELFIPVFGDDNAIAGIQQLDLTGSVRQDSYEDSTGTDRTWSLGVVWSPFDQVRFRANRSTAFLAPTLSQGLLETSTFLFPNGVSEFVYVDGVFSSINTLGDMLFLSGGNSELEPETARSFSFGVDIEPEAIPGLKLSVTHHETIYSNRISAPSIRYARTFFVDRPGVPYDAFGAFPLSGIEDPTTGEFWDGFYDDRRFQNLSNVDTDGIDALISYQRDTDIGEFYFTGNIAYTGKYDVNNEAGDVISWVDTSTQNVTIMPKYSYSTTLSWLRSGFSVDLNASTRSSTEFHSTSGLIRKREPPLLVNLQMAYDFSEGGMFQAPKWLDGTLVSLSITNITNDEGKLIQTLAGETSQIAGLSRAITNGRGRMMTLMLSKAFK